MEVRETRPMARWMAPAVRPHLRPHPHLMGRLIRAAVLVVPVAPVALVAPVARHISLRWIIPSAWS